MPLPFGRGRRARGPALRRRAGNSGPRVGHPRVERLRLHRGKAEAELRRLLGDADRGAHIAPAKLTLQQWTDQWIELKAAERQHKTVARYEDLLRLHVNVKPFIAAS